MIPPINLPKLHTDGHTRVKEYIFTLTDGSTETKKLKQVILPIEGMPRINIFEDNTFTVGQDPVVYEKGEDDAWIHLFRFTAIQVRYSTTLEVIEGGKGDNKSTEDQTELTDKDNQKPTE
jgi:hypothetical protein